MSSDSISSSPIQSSIQPETQSKIQPQITLSTQQLDLDELNRRFETAHPLEILSWCIANLPQGLVQTSSFGVDGMAIIDMLHRQLNHPVPVLFLDTLHHFPETLELVTKAKLRYGLDLRVYQAPVATREEFAAHYGEALWERDVQQFHAITKIEPLQRGLAELNAIAWITGRRRDQSDSRAQIPIIERDAQGRLKVNPLATWTRKDTWRYIVEHGVLYNPLHDLGYTSIGDQPLTTPVQTGEDERAGRWRGTAKTECGIHL